MTLPPETRHLPSRSTSKLHSEELQCHKNAWPGSLRTRITLTLAFPVELMSQPPVQHLRKFRFNRPQFIAALLLILFAMQCLLVIGATPPTMRDTHFAACGSQVWAPFSPPTISPAACPSLPEGILTYRAAGLPLAIHNWLAGRPANARPADIYNTFLLLDLWIRMPFLLAGLGLGACLWWVTRRLFGNRGGYVALTLYCFCPPIVLNASLPNPAILTAFGLFAAIYTAIGVAHAMQGPPRKWRKRILLFAVTLGFTAATSVLAFLLAFVISTVLLLWLAEDRRRYLPGLALAWTALSLFLFFASYGFHPAAFAFFSPHHLLPSVPTPHGLPSLVTGWTTAPTRIVLLIALIGYAGLRRARYFGNTTPLALSALLVLLAVTHVTPAAWLWTLPFLFTFLGGVFADLFEAPRRKVFYCLAAVLLLAQAALSILTVARTLPF